MNDLQYMTKKKNQFTRGFTIIEMTLYMGILTVLLAVLLKIFSSALDANLESQGNSTIQQDGRYIMAKLTYDIHQASGIVSPTLGNTTSSLQLTINGVTNTYSVSNSQFQVVSGGSTDVLSGYDANVSDVSFQSIGNTGGKPTLRIKYTLNSKTKRPSTSESATFQTTIGVR